MRRDHDGAADLRSVQRFAQRVWSPASRWHLGDLAWQLGQQPEGRPEWPMALWFDGAGDPGGGGAPEAAGELVAWGWLGLPGELELLVDPARPELVGEVLAWAAERATAPLTVAVLDSERPLVEELGRLGYRPDDGDPFFLANTRELTDLPPVPELPPGFRIRPVRADDADLARRAALHREVWHPSSVTDERYRRVAGGWPYRAEFDQVVVAPDGRFVAYCLGWYDEVNRVGALEPVGTVAAHRRQGLSRAVTISVLRAFRAAGGTRAVVYARGDDGYPVPRQVYAALGFTPHARTIRYRAAPESGPAAEPGPGSIRLA